MKLPRFNGYAPRYECKSMLKIRRGKRRDRVQPPSNDFFDAPLGTAINPRESEKERERERCPYIIFTDVHRGN